MTTRESISCASISCENKQYSQEYPEMDNISLDILNNDCLEHIFKFLPVVDRMRSERGEY